MTFTAPHSQPSTASRRTVLACAGLCAGAAALAGCATYSSSSPPVKQPTGGAPQTGPIAHTGDVPVGGGIVLDERSLVITQPAAGTFKGFSAVCTHLGCIVADVSDGTINCACHGSRYRITDGSVVKGPATRALPPKTLVVTGTDINLA